MFSNQLFYTFASQATTGFANLSGLVLYRDFVGDKQLNGPVSSFRIGPNISYLRNTNATLIDNAGFVQPVSINTPRFNHLPSTQYLGFLIEDQATNLAQYSTDFLNWISPPEFVSLIPNVPLIPAPDNTETATLLLPTNRLGFHVISWNGTPFPYEGEPNPVTDTYSRSIFVKKETARYIIISCAPQVSAFAAGGRPDFEGVANVFDFDLPGFLHESNAATFFEQYRDGWFRIGLSRRSTNANTNRLAIGVCDGPEFEDSKFIGDVNNPKGVYIWGGQVEKGGFSSSYIPTNGTAITRAADNAYLEGTSFIRIYNKEAGTYFTTVYHNGVFDPRPVATFISENGQRFMTLGTEFSGTKHIFKNTSSSEDIISNTINSKQFYDLTIGMEDNNFAFYQDNTLVKELTSNATLPRIPFRMFRYELGQFNNTKYLNGHIQKLGYYTSRLPNEQLSAI